MGADELAFIRDSKSHIEWLWIDTCCIDKNSSAELQESINSMFRWYRRARCCLAFLNDVGPLSSGQESVMKEFRGSVWFTRAWTLQELLAPATVLFVNRDWERIGYKGRVRGGIEGFVGCEVDLTGVIHEITGIRESVLYDYSSSRGLSFEEKQEWVVGRETTREEDKAYCLLGIFNVSMPLVYGEKRKAQKRLLKEIQEKEGETAVKREKKKKAKGKSKSKLREAEAGLQPILEENPMFQAPDAFVESTEPSSIELLPPASEYEDESTKEHRHGAIVSCLRNFWRTLGSRDEAILSLAQKLESMGYVDPGCSIHNAIFHAGQRASQVQVAYVDMMRMGWDHNRAFKHIVGVLEEAGHSNKIADALVREYLIFNPVAIDAWSLPYIPWKKPVEEQPSPLEEELKVAEGISGISQETGTVSIVVGHFDSKSITDSKLSGPGVSRQREDKEARHAGQELTFEAFLQMHLFS